MFGFTKQEKSIIIILIITFTIGTGIIKLREISDKNTSNEFKLKYSELDKKFSGISKSVDLSEIKKDEETEETAYLRININTADKSELMKLPGIGTGLSDRIIKYRENEGKFNDISELTNINGIGGKRFKKILPFIYVE